MPTSKRKREPIQQSPRSWRRSAQVSQQGGEVGGNTKDTGKSALEIRQDSAAVNQDSVPPTDAAAIGPQNEATNIPPTPQAPTEATSPAAPELVPTDESSGIDVNQQIPPDGTTSGDFTSPEGQVEEQGAAPEQVQGLAPDGNTSQPGVDSQSTNDGSQDPNVAENGSDTTPNVTNDPPQPPPISNPTPDTTIPSPESGEQSSQELPPVPQLSDPDTSTGALTPEVAQIEPPSPESTSAPETSNDVPENSPQLPPPEQPVPEQTLPEQTLPEQTLPEQPVPPEQPAPPEQFIPPEGSAQGNPETEQTPPSPEAQPLGPVETDSGATEGPQGVDPDSIDNPAVATETEQQNGNIDNQTPQDPGLSPQPTEQGADPDNADDSAGLPVTNEVPVEPPAGPVISPTDTTAPSTGESLQPLPDPAAISAGGGQVSEADFPPPSVDPSIGDSVSSAGDGTGDATGPNAATGQPSLASSTALPEASAQSDPAAVVTRAPAAQQEGGIDQPLPSDATQPTENQANSNDGNTLPPTENQAVDDTTGNTVPELGSDPNSTDIPTDTTGDQGQATDGQIPTDQLTNTDPNINVPPGEIPDPLSGGATVPTDQSDIADPLNPGPGQDPAVDTGPGTPPTDPGANSGIGSLAGGIGVSTSLITSAVSTTGRGGIGNNPTSTGTIIKETQSGGAGVSDAFSNPVTRTRSIVYLVGAIVGLILLVALIIGLWWFLRRRKKRKQEDSGSLPGDGEQGEMRISAPVLANTQQVIADYDPSAEVMGLKEAGFDLPAPSQLDSALVDRLSQMSMTRKSLLDIYGGMNTPYPQDVVDGSGRPLTQRFIMPNAEKFQLSGLGPMTPFNADLQKLRSRNTLQVPGGHQRNLSALSRLSGLPAGADPNQPAPYAPPTNLGPASAEDDPFADEEADTMPDLPVAGAAGMKSQARQPHRGQATDSWMTVNSVGPAGGRSGSVSQVRQDYNSVYMRNPFIDGESSDAPTMPTVPERYYQQPQTRKNSAGGPGETVPIMFNDSWSLPGRQTYHRPNSGPGATEVAYGIGEAYPPRPPSTMVGVGIAGAGGANSRARGPAYARDRRSNPFDLEEEGSGARPNGGGPEFPRGGDHRMSGTVKSVTSWLSGVADAEKSRMERDNVF